MSKELTTSPGESLAALDPKVLQKLSPKQARHLSWLAILGDDTTAMKRSGIARNTLRRWNERDHNYQIARDNIAQHKVAFAQENIKGLMIKAIQVLDQLLDSSDENVQARAVETVLKQMGGKKEEKSSQTINVHGDINFDDVNRARSDPEFRALVKDIIDGDFRTVDDGESS